MTPAALTSADIIQTLPGAPKQIDVSFQWYGRPTCDKHRDPCVVLNCTVTRDPHNAFTSPDFDTHGILVYFHAAFGLHTKPSLMESWAKSFDNLHVALVRNFNGLIKADGEINCNFRGRNPCLTPLDTMKHMASCRNYNISWLTAFRDVFTNVLE